MSDNARQHNGSPQTGGWIDVSVPVYGGMVHWPSDPEVEIERIADIAEGSPANLSLITMGAHTGTHIDAPLHFLADGAPIDQMPLAAMVGPARVIEIRNPRAVETDDLRSQPLERGDRILLKTANSHRCWSTGDFVEDFVGLSPAGAQYLVDRGVRTVGIDYLSIGGYASQGDNTHQVLLRAGIWVIEGLDLSSVPPGRYDLVCLPLRLVGAEGAPARAILRPIRS